MPISPDIYLRACGFHSDPFATTNAEQEREHLPSYFVHAPLFKWLVGDPRTPTSLILFAPPGHGKTSHRLEVGRLASERREDPALVIHFTDFDLLLADGSEPITINAYVTHIRRKVLEALDDFLRRHPERDVDVQRDRELFVCFLALLHRYASRRRLQHMVPSEEIEATAHDFERIRRSAKEWFQLLFSLANCAGFASVYVLLDGLDETSETRDDPEVIFRLLRPLLDAPSILQECKFAFKFFLPAILEDEMVRRRIGRLDRIPYDSLVWTEDQLLKMLRQRLSSYSRISETSTSSQVSSFQELCDTGVDVDQLLVEHAGLSPRHLIALAHEVIKQHCETAAHEHALITQATIEAAVRKCCQDTPQAASLDPLVQSLRAESPSEPTADQTGDVPQPLHLSKRGDVWIGSQRLPTRHFPKMLRLLLTYLWDHRNDFAPYTELERVLDPAGKWADPRSSRDHLVRRLRVALEPEKPDSKTYIDTLTGAGYVLRNWSDRDPNSM